MLDDTIPVLLWNTLKANKVLSYEKVEKYFLWKTQLVTLWWYRKFGRPQCAEKSVWFLRLFSTSTLVFSREIFIRSIFENIHFLRESKNKTLSYEKVEKQSLVRYSFEAFSKTSVFCGKARKYLRYEKVEKRFQMRYSFEAFSNTSDFVAFLCESPWKLSQTLRFFSPFILQNGAVWTGQSD